MQLSGAVHASLARASSNAHVSDESDRSHTFASSSEDVCFECFDGGKSASVDRRVAGATSVELPEFASRVPEVEE